jgi:hypothetical protein
MATVQEVSSIEEIKEHLNKSFSQIGKAVEEIKFEHKGFDSRNNWDTYYVLFRLNGEEQYSVAGMSDGVLEV